MNRPLRGRPRLAAVAVTGALALGTACGPDGPDAYTAEVDGVPVTTSPPRTLPPTSVAEPDAPPAETFPPNGEVVQVRSLDNTFRDETIEIAAGTEVLWTNNGRNEHNVLPTDERQDWGVDTEEFQPGDEYRLVFDRPGVFPYYCSIHGTEEVGMVGTVVVSAPTPDSEGEKTT